MTKELKSRVKCLIVDDVAENLEVLGALLQRDDVELLPARSGIEALEVLLNHDVALALINPGTIPAELLPRLFDPFQRAQSAKSRGLGLGLYIVQQIIRGHGGRVEVQSGVTDRTVLRVTLPRRPLDSE